jgi:hypothetical protein
MARYCLLEPGKPGTTYPGGWGDYTNTNDVLATLKALYVPIVSEEASGSDGCLMLYSTTHIAHIIDTNEDPPTIASYSCITNQGEASWVDS